MTALFSKLFRKKRPASNAQTQTTAKTQTPIEPSQLPFPNNAHTRQDQQPISNNRDIHSIYHLKDLEPSLSSKDEHLRMNALLRLETLIFGESVSELQKQQAIIDLTDQDALKLIALWHKDQDLQRQAIKTFLRQTPNGESVIYQWIQQCKTSRTKQQLAEFIEDDALLEQLYRTFRNRDKTLARQLNEKRAQKHRQQQQQQQSIAKQLQWIKQLELLATTVYSPTDPSQILHIKTQWASQQLPPPEAVHQRYQSALEQASHKIEQQQFQQQSEIKRSQVLKSAKQQQLHIINQLENLSIKLQELFEGKEQIALQTYETDHEQSYCKTVLSESEETSIQIGLTDDLESLKHQWNSTNNTLKADSLTRKHYQQTLAGLIQYQEIWQNFQSHKHALLDILTQYSQPDSEKSFSTPAYEKLCACIHTIHWPKTWKQPDTLLKARQQQIQSSKIFKSHQLQQAAKNKSYEQEIRALQQALNDKQLKTAQKHFQKASLLSKDFPLNQWHKRQAEYKRLSLELQELKDWQGFATKPKRDELCQQMEALIDQQLHPESLANAIQALQNEWKTLTGGDPKTHQEQWQRFKHASDQAYAPCKRYFQEQLEIRQRNFEARVRLCDELEQLLKDDSWDRTRWRGLQKIIDQAHLDWQTFSPVDRLKGKSLNTRFHAVIHGLRTIIQTVFDSNAEEKSALIEQAQHLNLNPNIQNSQNAVAKVKQLQKDWQSLGFAGKKDQLLWKQFRTECDTLFTKHRQQRQIQQDQQHANTNVAQNLLTKARGLLETPHPKALTTLQQFQQQLSEIALPQAVSHSLNSKMNAIARQLNNQCHQQKNQQQRQKWLNLRAKAHCLDEIEHWLIEGHLTDHPKPGNPIAEPVSSSPASLSLQQLIEHFEQITELPKGTEKVLDARWRLCQDALNHPENSLKALSENAYQLQILCIRLEMLTDTPTPKEDEQIKLDYQMKKLAEGLGTLPNKPTLEIAQAFEKEWYLIGSVNLKQRTPLSRRFFSIMDQLIEKLQKNRQGH